MLRFLIILLIINGCTTKECVKEDIIIKCVTPDVPTPFIHTYQGSANTSEKIKILYNNYVVMKEYALTLKKANEICK